MKDLLVSIPSRSRPDKLMDAIYMVLNTCDSKHNFDLQIIIDTDQVVHYSGVIFTYPDLMYRFIPYKYRSWQNIINAQHEAVKDYYFIWILPDDMEGLHKGWDNEILSKKKAFADDLFVLFTHGAGFWGRTLENHRKCYNSENGEDLVDAHEPNPILTYKWIEFMVPLFKPPLNYVASREYMIAEILRLLLIKHEINRNIESQIKYEFIKNDNCSVKMKAEWDALRGRGYDDLLPIVEKMKGHIDAQSGK